MQIFKLVSSVYFKKILCTYFNLAHYLILKPTDLFHEAVLNIIEGKLPSNGSHELNGSVLQEKLKLAQYIALC